MPQEKTQIWKFYKTNLQHSGTIGLADSNNNTVNIEVEYDGKSAGMITAKTDKEIQAIESSELFKNGYIREFKPLAESKFVDPFEELLTQNELYLISELPPAGKRAIVDNIRNVLKYSETGSIETIGEVAENDEDAVIPEAEKNELREVDKVSTAFTPNIPKANPETISDIAKKEDDVKKTGRPKKQ